MKRLSFASDSNHDRSIFMERILPCQNVDGTSSIFEFLLSVKNSWIVTSAFRRLDERSHFIGLYLYQGHLDKNSSYFLSSAVMFTILENLVTDCISAFIYVFTLLMMQH